MIDATQYDRRDAAATEPRLLLLSRDRQGVPHGACGPLKVMKTGAPVGQARSLRGAHSSARRAQLAASLRLQRSGPPLAERPPKP